MPLRWTIRLCIFYPLLEHIDIFLKSSGGMPASYRAPEVRFHGCSGLTSRVSCPDQKRFYGMQRPDEQGNRRVQDLAREIVVQGLPMQFLTVQV